MEEYIQALRKQLKGFSSEEQAALIEEIGSHIESGEDDVRAGNNLEQRRKRLRAELGTPEEMGGGFKAVYRPGRLIDYLLIAVPWFFYPYLYMLYISLIPLIPLLYVWGYMRLDIFIHLPLIVIGLWRRSAPLTIFWITVIANQLLYIVTQGYWWGYWYYGIQTVYWGLLLLGLLILFGFIVWGNRHDLLLVVYALLPFSMLVLGNVLGIIHPTSQAPYGFLDRSLLLIFLDIRNLGFYTPFVTMALFLLAKNRNIRWMALLMSGLMIGLGRDYLMDYQTGNMDLMAHWVYSLWAILPPAIVVFGWWLDKSRRQQVGLTA
jgi:hypothetical protein